MAGPPSVDSAPSWGRFFSPGMVVLLLVVLAALLGAAIALAISAIVPPAPTGGTEEESGRREDPDLFTSWLTDSRGIDDGGIPTNRYAEADREVREMLARQRELEESGDERAGVLAELGAAAHPWTWLGPSNWGGRTRGFVVHPDDPSIMLAAGVTGGVWRSEDGGESWTPLTDTFSNIAVGVIEFDPSDPNVVYAGTGEAALASEDRHRGDGIMKSADGGVSWDFLDSTTGRAEFAYVGDIEVSPTDSNRVYAATRSGVWMSVDGGRSWGSGPTLASGGSSLSVGCLELAIHPDAMPDRLLASCGNNLAPHGVFYSGDGGLSWQQTLPVDGQPIGRVAIAIAPGQPDVVYASVSDVPDTEAERKIGSSAHALYRSMQGGAPGTWEVRAVPGGPVPDWLENCQFGEPYAQGYYDHVIAVDPTDADRFWVGGVDLYRSEDGGATLVKGNDAYISPNEADGTSYAHADQHVIVFHPDYDGTSNRTVYFGNDGGLYATDDDRAALQGTVCSNGEVSGVAFRSMNEGYGISQFIGGAVSDDGQIVVGGTQDNGTFRLDGDRPSEWRQIQGGDGGNGGLGREGSPVYASYYGISFQRLTGDAAITGVCGLNECTDISSGIIDPDAAFYPPFEMDPSEPAGLWTGGTHVWRSRDEGGSWSKVSEPLGSVATAIAIWSGDGNQVWVGTRAGYVYRTGNALDQSPGWTDVDPSGNFPSAEVSSIATHPEDPELVYVAFRTFDGNQVWRLSGGQWYSVDAAIPDTPVNAVAINPLNPAMVYLGTDVGVFESLDGGETWRVGNENLASTIVNRLVFRRGTSELYAFTHGRGAFRVDVGTQAPPPNDDIAYAAEVAAAPVFRDVADVRVATSAPSDPPLSCGSQLLPAQAQTVWYRLQVGSAATFEVTTEGSNYDTVLAILVRDGGPEAPLGEVACNDDGIGQTSTSALLFDAEVGVTYYIEVARSASTRTETLANRLELTITRR